MMNNLGKLLVLVHASLSIAAMTWAIMLVLQGRDFGWIEPFRETVEWKKDGTEQASVRYASEYDKSHAALKEAALTRDLTFLAVKPALDAMFETEPYLPNNHLYFAAKIKELRESPDKIETKRLQDGGLRVPTPLSKPEMGGAVEGVDQSYKTYLQERKKVRDQIDKVEADIRDILAKTKEITAQLTGTDEKNNYVQPGLEQLVDLEYQTQVQIKLETERIKPGWSKALEQAKLLRIRYDDLLLSLQRLEAPPAKDKK